MPTPTPDDQLYDVVGECWIWRLAKNRHGYGILKRDGFALAHRWWYVVKAGREIPLGMVLDHLCRTPACVNPDHLEPVTQAENCRRGDQVTGSANARKTHCARGHEYTPENTRVRYGSNGRQRRACRTCERSLERARYHRNKKEKQ